MLDPSDNTIFGTLLGFSSAFRKHQDAKILFICSRPGLKVCFCLQCFCRCLPLLEERPEQSLFFGSCHSATKQSVPSRTGKETSKDNYHMKNRICKCFNTLPCPPLPLGSNPATCCMLLATLQVLTSQPVIRA